MKRRITWGVLAAALALALPALAQRLVIGYEALTVANVAIGWTAANYTDATGQLAQECVARLESAQIRFRLDGTAPTSSEGQLLEVGEVLTVRGTLNIQNFKAIRTGSTSGTLRTTCAR